MILPTYREYKESGLDWALELPAHWGRARLKWLSERYSGGTPDKTRQEFWEGGTIPWLNSGAVNDGNIYAASAYITHDAYLNSSAKWIPAGALLMALAGQGKTKGMVAQLMFRSTCNQSMAAIVPTSRIEVRFLYWWLTCNYQNIRNLAGGDLRDGLNLDLIGSISCPLPPIDEQVSIAAFLDRETKKIDSLIQKQEKLVELLEEKCKSIISESVFSGLDPSAQLRKFGSSILVSIPQHWEVKKFRYLGKVNPAPGAWFGSPDDDVEFFPMDAIGQKGDLDRTRYKPYRDAQKGYSSFSNGDVVVAKVTPCFENGKGALISELKKDVAFGSTELTVLRPGDLIDAHYLYFITMSNYVRQLGASEMFGAGGLKRVPDEFFRDLLIPLPPLSEQMGIVDLICQKIARIELLLSKARAKVDLLKERRTSLIYETVTGRIDVRGLA